MASDREASCPREQIGASPWTLKLKLFGLSFTALFLELMVIRWVPSEVKAIAYYANLMLLSSFLGLGLGALASGSRWRLFSWFPLLLATEVAVVIASRDVVLASGVTEVRFGTPVPYLVSYIVLLGIFVLNTVAFLPLGQRMGELFDALPCLAAYGWDLGGSLCGTLCFGVFSLELFSPLLGIAIVMVLYLAISGLQRLWLTLPTFLGLLVLLGVTREPMAIWSPYYHIVVTKVGLPAVVVSEPEPNLLTARDPPVYAVAVNQFGYHYDAALDLSRYTPGTAKAAHIKELSDQYSVPFTLCSRHDRVLVVGAGGGNDVEGALAAGAKYVDAVEIDPAIVQISRRFNAGAPYADPRVTVHVDDARSFLSRARPGYDLVVYGYLDSQALFSSMSNVRLDGFVYTVEGLRTAYGLVRDGGMLTLSFRAGRDWLVPKLYRMMAEATGQTPILYLSTTEPDLVLCVPKGYVAKPPAALYQLRRVVFDSLPTVEPATDDWPFLYLSSRTIPRDYLVAIGGLLVLSLVAIGGVKPQGHGRSEVFFGCLGMGFLLLETKSISDCTLYFGATWFVTVVVVAGVLLMVLAGNLVAGHLSRFSMWMYAPLFAALVVLYLVPRQEILQLSFGGRLVWTLVAVPLPVFFAGLIFSTNFRDAARPSALFGANLIGAMVGGFGEYLGMVIGSHQLSLLVIVAYLASLAVSVRLDRVGAQKGKGAVGLATRTG